MLIEPAEINALLKLVDDPDEGIQLHVREKITEYGLHAIPYIEKVWNLSTTSDHLRSYLEQIHHQIHFRNVKELLLDWSLEKEPNLMEGFILVSMYEYPDISAEYIKKYLEKIKQDIWLELNPNLTAFEQIKVFNKVFFEIYGFRGNVKNYHSPKNSYINTVLEAKKGNPLSLSIIYMHIAQSLDFPLYGINLPNHFVLGYVDVALSHLAGNSNSNVVFYVNPYSKGALLMNGDLERFLKELKLPLKDEFLLPCDSTDIIIRVLNNLINSYKQENNPEKAQEITELKDLISLKLNK
jgi:regulator of sirC expression with transglutaminase-like and TPR domain